MSFSLLLTVLCFASSALSKSLLSPPCRTDDTPCMEKSINGAIPALTAGIPALNMDPSDPLFLKLIEGNLSTLKYKFHNTTITGYKDCVVKNIKVDKELTSAYYELHCPAFQMSGQYEIDGHLIILPVEGVGDYYLATGKYSLYVDSELKKMQGSDGKTYLTIKNFKLKCKAEAPIKFDFKNLFNGQKDLSDAVHKFANENWAEVSEFVQDPVYYAGIKKITSNVNKYLKTVPIDEYVLS